ncbi:FHA domain-containing protein PS1 isoform X2 [Lotus japonicus]|uniref:FHA domain-containing protein PS1 isoform X2 n=1 Tax=Lotus japonicus TaxID=34305 RepID=UPI00258E7B1A|nr:FHA domain-containing protein PS1 isoform X2 [Lotus japonicus]
MASEKNPEEEEGKIPVLTVLKNESILKNIFIVNKPPEDHSPRRRHRDHEDILLVGRHPDCDLMLTHPSISRYHLHIRSVPSSLSFSVIDLSSVHGTWVSGRKIEAGVRVEMKEGDTLRIGVSSRVYRLHWIPISRAYDLENPFVPEMHALVQQGEEEEDDDDDDDEEQVEEEIEQELNSCPVEMKGRYSVDSILESINSLFLDENVELTVKEEEISASPQMLEDNVSSCCPDDKEEIQSVDSILECLKDEVSASPQMLKDNASSCCPDDKEEIQSVDSILGCLNTLFLDENVEVTVKEEILAAPQMLEDSISLSHEGQVKRQSKDEEFGVSSEPYGSKAAYWPTSDVEDKQVVVCVNTMATNLSEGECLSVVESVSGAKMLQIQSPQDTFTSPLPHRVENSFAKHQSSFQVLSPAYLPESVVRCDNTIAENLYEDECLPVLEAVSGTKMLPIQSPQDTFTSSLLPHTENTFSEKLDQDDCLTVPEAVSGTDMLQIKSPRDTFATQLTPPLENSVEKHCSSFRVQTPTFVESFVEGDNTLAEYLLEDESFPVLEAVPWDEMQQIQSPQDTLTLPLPPCVEDSFEKHCSSINLDSASFDVKIAAEAVLAKESECTARDNGRAIDTLTVGAGIFNSQNMFLPVEEVIPGTIFQQSKFIEEVAMDSQSDGKNQDRCDQWHIPLQRESVNLPMTQEDLLNITNETQTPKPDMETLESCKETMEKSSKNQNIWSRRGKATNAPLIQTRKSVLKGSNADNEAAMSDWNNIINKAISKDLLSVLDTEEEIFTPDKENFRPNMLQLRFLKKSGKLEETKHSKSQSSKDKTISKDLFSVLDGEKEEEEIYTPDKENFSPNTLHLRRMKRFGKLEETKHSKSQRSCSSKDRTISKDLFSVLDGENEEEVYTPDKENFSPNTLHLRRMKKKGKLEEIKHSKSRWSPNPKGKFGPNIYSDESRSPTSNKENQTPKRVQDQKLQKKPFGTHIKLTQEHDVNALKNRVERVPFQSLKISGTSSPVSAEKSIDVRDCEEISDKHNNPSDTSLVQKRSWDMIVDTTTLMNKESRKALQLLQGLKGTRLIVPRLVIRELQSMKQQNSFFRRFRRISEASLALEWVEECMVNTNWWIHIQSSVDEGRRIAPTPPASPQTQICEESWSFHGGIGSFMEIPSPTIEDHILDFTLLHKRKQIDGQLVLLSEDVTLKINCMAEGLLCEPVQEFRESLVNPFSERFLWKNSSARGQTWCCEDDVVLRERYCRLPLRKSSKGAASGLKLILLHNSQYGH